MSTVASPCQTCRSSASRRASNICSQRLHLWQFALSNRCWHGTFGYHHASRQGALMIRRVGRPCWEGVGLRAKRRRSVVGSVVLLLTMGFFVAACSKAPTASSSSTSSTSSTSSRSTSSSSTSSSTTSPPSTTTTMPVAHIGNVALDGDFAFIVKSLQCGLTHLGNTFLSDTAPAGSQWCLVSMRVTDDKSVSQTFFASNQYAYDPAGKQLSATTGALLYLTHGATDSLDTINPGVSVTVQVPFQLSSSDSIAKFVLHDSAYSGGVTVENSG